MSGETAIAGTNIDHAAAPSDTAQIAPADRSNKPIPTSQLYRSADALLRQGRVEEAQALYRLILERDPGDIGALRAMGRIERRRGDDIAAAAYIAELVRLAPDDRAALIQWATLLRETQQTDAAVEVYRRLLAKDPCDVQCHLGLGRIERTRGDLKAARAHFAAAVAVAEALARAADAGPDRLADLQQLAVALREADRVDEAIELYRTILGRDVRHAPANLALGWILAARGELTAARGHFEAAAEADPGNAQTHLGLGRILARLQRPQDAAEAYQRALAIAPRSPQIHAALGALARATHDPAGAYEQFQTALAADPANTSFRLELARTCCELARWDEADHFYRQILTALPGHLEALLGLAQVARALGDRTQALAWLEQAAAAAPLDLRPPTAIRYLTMADGSYDWRTEATEAARIARSPEAAPAARLEAAKILVQYGLTQVAGPVLEQLERHFPAARQLTLAVRQIERMGLAQPSDSHAGSEPGDDQLEALHGFLEKPVPGSDTLLIVFAGRNNRLWVTFSLLHRILSNTGVSIVYVRDLQQDWYMRGVVGIGQDFDATVAGFRAMAARHGASRILTIGNCVGCLGALRFGLRLEAAGVLCLSAKLRPGRSLEPGEKTQLEAIRAQLPPGHKNIRTRYLEAAARPEVALIFCPQDAEDAAFMAEVPGVTATEVPNSAGPDAIKDLLVRGLLEPLLTDFVAHRAVSPRLHALIASSASP